MPKPQTDFSFSISGRSTPATLDGLKATLAREFPDLTSVPRHRFVMAEHLADKVLQRQKCTTIRYDRDAVEYPANHVLPLYSVEEGQGHDTARCLADLRILSVRYAPVRGLTDADARDDGFATKHELLETLERFYGHLRPYDTVCIYAFRLNEDVEAHDASIGVPTSREFAI